MKPGYPGFFLYLQVKWGDNIKIQDYFCAMIAKYTLLTIII